MVRLYGDQILRATSSPVTSAEKTEMLLRHLSAERRLKTVCAPEIGILERVLLLNSWHDGTGSVGEQTLIVNPVVRETWGESTSRERCPCLPDQSVQIKRPWRCKVSYFDSEMVCRIKTFQGWKARAIFHALDHFKGVLISDHLSRSSRSKIQPFYGYRPRKGAGNG